jgi:hypothetical protein
VIGVSPVEVIPVADAAIGGQRAITWLQVRRVFRDEPACKKRTFAEQVPGLTVRYGRKTPLLAGMLHAIAVALAGRAACRLARALHAAASRSTLLRLVMTVPDPPAPAPRVVGVDDFAIRRGQNYGTLLIRTFAAMVTQLTGESLPWWSSDVRADTIASILTVMMSVWSNR